MSLHRLLPFCGINQSDPRILELYRQLHLKMGPDCWREMVGLGVKVNICIASYDYDRWERVRVSCVPTRGLPQESDYQPWLWTWDSEPIWKEPRSEGREQAIKRAAEFFRWAFVAPEITPLEAVQESQDREEKT